MELSVTTPAPRPAWAGLYAADPRALVSQSPQWVDSLCALGGWRDASRLYEAPDGSHVLLPLVERAGLGARLGVAESMPPAWGYGGPLSSRPLDAGLAAALLGDLAAATTLRTRIRPNPLDAAAWAAAARAFPGRAGPGRGRGLVSVPRRAHVLDLGGGFATVWSRRFTSGTRNKVRRAERAALAVECDTSGRLVPVFHDLLRRSFDRWADQQHEPRLLARWRGLRRDPLDKFALLASRLGEAFRLWVAWAGGEPAAAVLVLRGADAHYTRGAMDKELAGRTHANTLLHRLAIEDACLAGCRRYHMGESGASKGLDRFKSRLGAVAVGYAEYRLERLPLTRAEDALRGAVKRAIGFREPGRPGGTGVAARRHRDGPDDAGHTPVEEAGSFAAG